MTLQLPRGTIHSIIQAIRIYIALLELSLMKPEKPFLEKVKHFNFG